jgi:hypothetical protein
MTTTAIATAQAATPVSAAARPAKTEIRQPKALPVPNSDFYQLSDVLTDAFPFELLPSLKEMQLGGFGHRKIADLSRN